MRLATTFFYSAYNTKSVEGTFMRHFSVLCTKYPLSATDTLKLTNRANNLLSTCSMTLSSVLIV